MNVSLGEILTRSNESAVIEPSKEYHEVTIRLWGKGIISRGKIRGAEIGGARSIVRHGQLILSKIDARNGAIGLVPPELDSALVSNDFPSYNFRPDAPCLPEYIGWLVKSAPFIALCQVASEGTTNRVRIREDRFLEQQITLPPISEQAATVAKLNLLADKTRQLNERLAAIEADAANLLRTFVFGCTERRLLADLVRQKSPDITVNPSQTYQFAGVYSFGRGVFKSACKTGSEFAYPRLSTVNKGNFIYPKLMAWEGALGVVPEECDGMVVSPEFPVFEVNQDLVIPEVLDIYFKTPTVWQALAEISGGTNMRRRRLQPSAFLAHRIPVPSPTIQKAIRSLHQKLQEVRARNSQISAANDALIPATLERVFLR